jgi:hypothetical protein
LLARAAKLKPKYPLQIKQQIKLKIVLKLSANAIMMKKRLKLEKKRVD